MHVFTHVFLHFQGDLIVGRIVSEAQGLDLSNLSLIVALKFGTYGCAVRGLRSKALLAGRLRQL